MQSTTGLTWTVEAVPENLEEMDKGSSLGYLRSTVSRNMPALEYCTGVGKTS